jgi:hypothetical protein
MKASLVSPSPVSILVSSSIGKVECQRSFGANILLIWKQGVCHTVALPFTLKSILRQKKNYGNSNISPCKKYNLKKNPLKETKIL